MKKFKVIYKEQSLSDKEIEEFMDFSETLKKSEKLTATKTTIQYLKYGPLTLTVLFVASSLYYFYTKDIKRSGELETGDTKSEVFENNSIIETNESEHVNSSTVEKNTDQNTIQENPSQIKADSTTSALRESKQHIELSERKLSSALNEKKTASKFNKAVSEKFVEAHPVKGYPNLYDYFADNLQYPEKAKKDSTQGTILVEFEILESGAIENIRILKGKTTELDKEAVRLISSMPAWNPAFINGKPVSTRLTLPLTFQLEQSK